MRFSEPQTKAFWDNGWFYVQTIMRPLITGGWGKEKKKKQNEREQFEEPNDVAIDSNGNIFVLEGDKQRILKYK